MKPLTTAIEDNGATIQPRRAPLLSRLLLNSSSSLSAILWVYRCLRLLAPAGCWRLYSHHSCWSSSDTVTLCFVLPSYCYWSLCIYKRLSWVGQKGCIVMQSLDIWATSGSHMPGLCFLSSEVYSYWWRWNKFMYENSRSDWKNCSSWKSKKTCVSWLSSIHAQRNIHCTGEYTSV